MWIWVWALAEGEIAWIAIHQSLCEWLYIRIHAFQWSRPRIIHRLQLSCLAPNNKLRPLSMLTCIGLKRKFDNSSQKCAERPDKPNGRAQAWQGVIAGITQDHFCNIEAVSQASGKTRPRTGLDVSIFVMMQELSQLIALVLTRSAKSLTLLLIEWQTLLFFSVVRCLENTIWKHFWFAWGVMRSLRATPLRYCLPFCSTQSFLHRYYNLVDRLICFQSLSMWKC